MIDFAATTAPPPLACPGGAFEGDEYVVRNPKRTDLSPGSFKISVRTGKWGDFAAEVGGGDPVSLWAFLDDVKLGEAAKRVAERLVLTRAAAARPSARSCRADRRAKP